MFKTKIVRRWLAAAFILSLVFSLISPAAAIAAETKKLQSSLLADQMPLPSEGMPSSFDHSLKLEAMNGQPDHRAYAPFEAKKLDTVQPVNYVPASDSSEIISVIVELNTEPVAVHHAKMKKGLKKNDAAHQSKLSEEQAKFAASINKLNAKLKRQYKHVFNGFSVTIPANQTDILLTLPGVKAVYPDLEVSVSPIDSITPNMDESAPFIGSDALWDLGFDGTGIKVGVLDTGIDYNHPSLAGAYKGGYDFVDDDADPMETPPDPNDPEAATDHGTHVAGTIAGRGNPLDPDQGTGWVRGVAYGSDIYAYRVLGPGGNGSYEDVIAAIERSVLDGMDVINLSLGSSVNNRYDATSIALNNAMLDGVVAVTSSGNNGPGPFTLGSPGTADLAISVGASSPPLNVPTILAEGVDKVYGSIMSFSPELGDLRDQSLELVYAGLGTASDFEGLDLTGKVALISRGSIAFSEKSLNAKAAGAVAAIVYNNAPGNFGGTLGSPGDYIPTLSISQEDGGALLAKVEPAGFYPFTFGIELEQDLMGDFSSVGPALPGLTIKPDIVAPGVAIRSSIPAFGSNYEDAYADSQGTSMAAPHVAGAAALLLQKDETLSPFEVKSLMMNNAVKIVDRDGRQYSNMEQGAGRIDLKQTIEAKAAAMVEQTTNAVPGAESMPYYTGSISFGQVYDGFYGSRTITVKDIAGEPSSYTISAKWYGTPAGSMAANLAGPEDLLTVAAGGSSEFEIWFTLDEAAADGRYEGEVVLTEAGGHTLQIPFTVYVGEVALPDVISDIEIDPLFFSPNNDGAVETTDIRFKVNLATSYFSLEVYDAFTSEWKGTIAASNEGIDPGSYIVQGWNGVAANGSGAFRLEEGLYVIVPWTGDGSQAAPIPGQASPFVIDVNAPVSRLNDPAITVQDGVGTITGQIESDFMIDLFENYSAIGVAALYDDKGWVQVNGVIAPDGSFSIQVPVKPGLKTVEVYVYDIAGNGTVQPAFIVDLKEKGKPMNPVKPDKPDIPGKKEEM